MNKNNREIERKYIIESDYLDLKTAAKLVKSRVDKSAHTIFGKSKDIYWNSPNPKNADFIRLRFLSTKNGQLTLKHSDKGHNYNRVEIDLEVDNNKQAHCLMNKLLGKSVGTIHKNYIVYFLSDGTAISIYKVNGDKRLIVEIESNNLKKISKIYNSINKAVKLVPEPRSLYQMFFKS